MWLDPLTALGSISMPFFISNLATFLGFILATFFSVKYTLKFYEGRPKPISWTFIVTGLASFCISELGQFLLPYRSTPTELEAIIVLAAQNFGVILIAVGCFMLLREVLL